MELTKTKSYEQTDQFVKCQHCNKDIYIKKIDLHEPRCKENLLKKDQLVKKKSEEKSNISSNVNTHKNLNQYHNRPNPQAKNNYSQNIQTTYNKPFSGKPAFLGQDAQKQLEQQILCEYCGHPQPLYNLQAHEYQCQESSKCKYCNENFPPLFLNEHFQVCQKKGQNSNYQNQYDSDQDNNENQNDWDWDTNNNKFLSKQEKKMIAQLAQKAKHHKKGLSKIQINSMKPTPYRKKQTEKQSSQLQKKIQSTKNVLSQQIKNQNEKNQRSDFLDQFSDNQMCSICYLQFLEDDPVLELKCEHTFHSECVKKWLQINSTCPNCKQQL